MIVSITTFTLIHTLISLVAIVAGLVVVGGLMAGGPRRWRLRGARHYPLNDLAE